MPQRDNERIVVEGGNAKPNEINRANDPKPFFKLELGCAHLRICSGASPPLQSAAVPSVGRKNEPVPFAVFEHRVGAPRLLLRWAFKFDAAFLQLCIRLIDVVARV